MLDLLFTEVADEHPVPAIEWRLTGPVLLLVLLPVHRVALQKEFILIMKNNIEEKSYSMNLGDVRPEGGVIPRGVVTEGAGADPTVETRQSVISQEHSLTGPCLSSEG